MNPSPTLALHVPPRISDEDFRVLGILVQQAARPAMRILEVGSFLGNGSTKAFIEALRPVGGRLICVDTWQGSPNVAWHVELAAQHDLLATFQARVLEYCAQDMVETMVMTSLEAASRLPDASLDLVFLDGDHSYRATSADIAAWLPKLRPGGILCGHDCEGPVSDFDPDALQASRHLDFMPLEGYRFAGAHPGVVLAVHESFAGAARLFAEEDFTVHGLSGRSSVWAVVVEALHA